MNRKRKEERGRGKGLSSVPFLFLLSTFLFIFLGCGKTATHFNGREITIWETYGTEEHDVFVKIVEEFEKKYSAEVGTPVHIKVNRVPFADHVKRLKFAAITRTAPDIARIDAGELIDLVYGQTLINLQDLDPDIDSYLATFTAPARETVRIPLRHPDGNVRTGVYGIPDQITGVAIYYNRKMFREKGIPFPPMTLAELENANPRWTFDRFTQVAENLTDREKDIYGIALSSSLWFSLPFFNAFGANFIELTPEGKFVSTLTTDSAINALEALASLYWKKIEPGAWLPGARAADQGFVNQNYAMIVSGPWNLKTFELAGVDFGVTFIPEGPAVRAIETPHGTVHVGTSTNVGGTDMAILKTCKDPELAYAFLKYLMSPQVHARWCNELGQIPVQTLAEPMVDFSKNPRLAVFMEQIRTAIPRPKIPRYGVLEAQVMVPQIERAFQSGNRDGVKASLEQAGREMNRQILEDVNVPR